MIGPQIANIPPAQVSLTHYHAQDQQIAHAHHGVHQHVQSNWIDFIYKKVINGLSTSASIGTIVVSGSVGTYLLHEGVRKISSPRLNKAIEDRIWGAIYCASGIGFMAVCRLVADPYMPQTNKRTFDVLDRL